MCQVLVERPAPGDHPARVPQVRAAHQLRQPRPRRGRRPRAAVSQRPRPQPRQQLHYRRPQVSLGSGITLSRTY